MEKSKFSGLLANWIPRRLIKNVPELCCDWVFTGKARYTEPFFDDTIGSRLSLAENSSRYKIFSTIDILREWAEEMDSVYPSAFIFHVSRCGSTLASQLLGLETSNIVLSEVGLLDEILRLKYSGRGITGAEITNHFKAGLAFYAAKRDPAETRLFIKTDSWHIHFYNELRSAYPGVPFILLYRDPVEVLRSQQKHRGRQAVQGIVEAEVFGFDPAATYTDLDQYMVMVLETYFSAFIKVLQKDPLCIPVNYNEGPIATVAKIAAAGNMTISDSLAAAMQQRTGYHAKYPGQVFSGDGEKTALPKGMEKVVSLYDQLEAMRLRFNAKPV